MLVACLMVIGFIALAIFLIWLFVNLTVSIIGMLIPIAAGLAIFYILYRLIHSVDKDAANQLFTGLLGAAIFILILWRVF